VLDGTPHGGNGSHAPEFNQALINFLSRQGRGRQAARRWHAVPRHDRLYSNLLFENGFPGN
jgi:hypothetical protein